MRISAGRAFQGGGEIEFVEALPAIRDASHGQDRQRADLGRGLGPPVGFDDADEDIHALRRPLAAGVEHLPGLADARCRTKKDAQACTPLGGEGSSERIRVGAYRFQHRYDR